jgi:putative ABC transport system permease protein
MTTPWDRTWRDIWDGMRSQPGRIGLSFLAILVGITALTILLAVLGGLEDRSRRIVQELGVNVFGITQAACEENGKVVNRLEKKHVKLLKENLPGCLVAGLRTYDVPTLGMNRSLKVVSTDDSLFRVRQWRLVSGRFLDAEDVRSRSRHAVINVELNRFWGWKVGDSINILATPYEVVGTVETESGALETESVDLSLSPGKWAVFVPGSTPAYWLRFEEPPERLDAVFVRVPDAGRFEEVMAAARTLLSQPAQRPDNLSMITPEVLLRKVRRLQNTIKLTVGSIAVLCLILGGTTLMSLMVANVRDRVVEIGLRRALGATAGDIAGLFVWEGCLVTASAAVAGAVLTHGVLFLVQGVLPVPVSLGLNSFLVPIAVAVGLGIAFSYWPARFAARIVPSDALRND